jgi:hypothetical protein
MKPHPLEDEKQREGQTVFKLLFGWAAHQILSRLTFMGFINPILGI